MYRKVKLYVYDNLPVIHIFELFVSNFYDISESVIMNFRVFPNASSMQQTHSFSFQGKLLFLNFSFFFFFQRHFLIFRKWHLLSVIDWAWF